MLYLFIYVNNLLYFFIQVFFESKFSKTVEECARAIKEFRLSLTSKKCQNYINKINEVFIKY